MSKIEFWFAFGSTYSYLSVMRISDICAEHKIDIEWRPFLLTTIFRDLGMEQGPYLPFPPKLNYMWRDLERRAARHGLPYRRPSHYPINMLLTCQIGVIAQQEGWCEAFTREAFRLHWQEGVEIGTEANTTSCLSSLQKDAEEVVRKAQSDANKLFLHEQTNTAKDIGIFGSPTFVVGKELFWGDDRLEDAVEWSLGRYSTSK